MLYTTRFRVKESVTPAESGEVHRVLDTKVIPAVLKVEGVNAFDVYQSNNGELVGLVNIDNLAAVDSILVNPGCRAVFGEFAALTMRTGGELLFGRPAWQALYGEEK